MSAKPPPPGPARGSSSASRRSASKDDDEDDEDDEEEEVNDFVPDDDDDDDDDDSEFDEEDNAASSDDDGAHSVAILEGILALDESKHLHFQGDAFHLVSTEPLNWGVVNFAKWKSLSNKGDGATQQHTFTMQGEFQVEVPWQKNDESSKGAADLKSPPSSQLKSPPSASPSGSLKSPPSTTDATPRSNESSLTNGSQKAFRFDVSITDYTGTKSDPSIRRIDHEHTHVPTNPDCMYHIEAIEQTSLLDGDESGIGNHTAAPPLRFRGDYFPKDSDDPCRTVCKFVKPPRNSEDAPDRWNDAQKPAAAIPGGTLSVENGFAQADGDEKNLSSSTAAAAAFATSPYAAAAARGSLGGDDDFEANDDDDDDADGDYDEDVDGDELLALQQEAAMSTDEVLRKRYRGDGGAKEDADGDRKVSSATTTKRGRRRDDDDDDSDYGF